MKYIIILGDGMADEPLPELGEKTPLEYAKTPTLDALAPFSEQGLVRTIPEGMNPGSDTANLAVMGYDPNRYYTGRSPLEALSIGVDMKPDEVAIRTNLVTLSEEEVPYEKRVLFDHSSDEISTEEAAVLLDAVKEAFQSEQYQFYCGTSYRHLLIWSKGETVELTPPHDILTRPIGSYLPENAVLREMMEKSFDLLNQHPLNLKRAAEGKKKANSIWFWGAGTRPALSSFYEKTGKKGAMISAVDLLKGIAAGTGMVTILVPGANGGLHTNYEGKADAAVKALLEDGADFVYVHVEAPDEMGHQGSAERKVLAIEFLDQRLISRVVEKMDASGEAYRLLILPDHPTPIRCRTHVSDPVPYLLYDSQKREGSGLLYSEVNAGQTGIVQPQGYRLIEQLLEQTP